MVIANSDGFEAIVVFAVKIIIIITIIYYYETATERYIEVAMKELCLFSVFSTGWSIPSVGSHVVTKQPKTGGVQQRQGGVAVRRGWREKGQVSH